MTKTITLLIAVAIIAGSFALLPRATTNASLRSPLDGSPTCGDQYNALVKKAKDALARGDRAGAISGLLEARNQLSHCEELEERNARAPKAVALNTF